MLWYFKIAFSFFFAAMSLVLLGIWVRSHWWSDHVGLQFSNEHYCHFASEKGKGAFLIETIERGPAQIIWNPWPLEGLRTDFFPFNSESPGWLGFDARWFGVTDWGIFAPHWFVLLVTAALSTAPWIRWSRRFSLRSLLIAMTIVAVVLGIVVISR